MRIDPTAILAIDPKRERPAATPAAASRPRDPAAVVSLGESAAAAQAQPANPGVTAKISRIRELLAGGDYVVDLDKLSERILDDDVARMAP
jgi:anti-sigma28 factor (negative regulator of flagellin synthesis)